MKKTIVAILVVFVAWTVLDFVMHGLILKTAPLLDGTDLVFGDSD